MLTRGEATAAGLHGEAEAIVDQIRRYVAAGVQHLVIEPISSDLNDFVDQMTRFAHDVMPIQ
jgi:alkanesulfonate monooxygenase SsuD/methylene tetrahydromethanopterin reductase-like flavin-dependent oxidoreductase (luciferase family)